MYIYFFLLSFSTPTFMQKRLPFTVILVYSSSSCLIFAKDKLFFMNVSTRSGALWRSAPPPPPPPLFSLLFLFVFLIVKYANPVT